jgi:hypothetical protein
VLGWLTCHDAWTAACDQALQGWARWGLQMAASATREQLGFAEGMLRALSMGGDTDTNGAILGAALGARLGLGAIPREMRAMGPGRVRLVATRTSCAALGTRVTASKLSSAEVAPG